MTGSQVVETGYDYAAAQRLWRAVLLEQWRLIFDPVRRDKPHEYRSALAFFQSADLHVVCALAGLDSMMVFQRWLDEMDAHDKWGDAS